jgi:hypothetical protein
VQEHVVWAEGADSLPPAVRPPAREPPGVLLLNGADLGGVGGPCLERVRELAGARARPGGDPPVTVDGNGAAPAVVAVPGLAAGMAASQAATLSWPAACAADWSIAVLLCPCA